MLKRFGLTVLAMALATCSSMAADRPGMDWVRQRVNELVQRPPYDWNIAQIKSQMRSTFLAQSQDGKTITQRDAELAQEIALTQAQAIAMQQVLIADLNHDGRITRQNMRLVLQRQFQPMSPDQREKQIDQRLHQIFVDDGDHDDVLTLDEIRDAVKKRQDANSYQAASPYQNRNNIPLSLSPSDNGTLTIEDFIAAVQTVFDEFDGDHDGTVSQPETASYTAKLQEIVRREAVARQEKIRAAQEAARLQASAFQCGFGTLDGQSAFAFVAIAEGRAAASFSIYDGMKETNVAHIRIEPGEKPLALLVSSQSPTIWQISGAKERISRVMVLGAVDPKKGAIGAISGIPLSKIRFATEPACLAGLDMTKQQEAEKAADILFKRKPDHLVQKETAGTIGLPSGTIEDGGYPGLISVPTDSPASAIWEMFRDSHPGGLVKIELDGLVVSPSGFPRKGPSGYSGLATLIEDGSLNVISWRSIRRFGANGPVVEGNIQSKSIIVQSVPNTVRVTTKLRFPAGIPYGTIQTVLVPEGIEAPENLPQGACLRSEKGTASGQTFGKVSCGLQ